jgi:hypothetical protein
MSGYMKELDARIRNGGDDAIAAACELADLAKERRGYDETMRAGEDITDIVTVLRGVGFSAVSPQAGDSASLLHYCVTHAADEIEHLRNERRWIPVGERLPEEDQEVLVWNGGGQCLKPWQGHVLCEYRNGEWRESQESDLYPGITHWMKLPEPPEMK